ncbi:hypothetical protein T484DRAFT_1929409 [Baffinella frigidus]|nr:hypothetical protein T484DRAFT_1929409 [Cryptophyta sp. CCMP2293]
MGAHGSIAGVQEQGCKALANLAENYENDAEEIVRAGGIVAVVAEMGANTSDARVQLQGCRALGSLAETIDEEGVPALRQRWRHTDRPGVENEGGRVLKILRV